MLTHPSPPRPRRRVRRLTTALAAVTVSVTLAAGGAPAAVAAPPAVPTPVPTAGAAACPARSQPVTRWGMADHGALGVDQSTYGRFGVFRVYYRGLPTGWRRVDGFRGRQVVVSFHDSPARVLSGRDDAALARWFASAPVDKDVTWSWNHEYDRAVRRHHRDPAPYRAGWRHLIDVAHRANPRLTDTLILTAYAFNHGPLDGWRAFYPGPAVDSIAVDGYSWHRHRTSSPAAIFGRAIAAARSVGEPFGVAEVAALAPRHEPDRLARWIYGLRDYLEANRALFVAWFNVNFRARDAWGSWRLTQAPVIAAFRDVLHAGDGAPPAPPALPATPGVDTCPSSDLPWTDRSTGLPESADLTTGGPVQRLFFKAAAP